MYTERFSEHFINILAMSMCGRDWEIVKLTCRVKSGVVVAWLFAGKNFELQRIQR